MQSMSAQSKKKFSVSVKKVQSKQNTSAISKTPVFRIVLTRINIFNNNNI